MNESAQTSQLIARLRRQRNMAWCFAVVLLGVLAVRECWGEDCLNRDLAVAAGDALAIAKHQGGHARLRYITLYGVPERDRLQTMAGISCLCHQLSHAGVTIQPQKVTDTVWRLDLNLYDPHGVGWEQGWEQIVGHDRRYHYGTAAPLGVDQQRVFVGNTISVKCSDGVFRDAVVRSLNDDGFVYELLGKTYTKSYSGSTPAVKYQNVDGAYGDWVDFSTAKLLEEITGSSGAMLDGREFAYYASRTNIYYTFRNTPGTLSEWLKSWGEFESRGFGHHGVRGANLNKSNVTFTVRGLERRRLPVWLTFDQSKAFDLDDGHDPFVLPDRSHKFRATEAFAFTSNGGMDCAIFDGDGKRVDFVPGAVALDTSHGPARELRPGLSCWSCHSQSLEAGETAGVLDFADEQSRRKSYVKDPKLAAELAAYYGNQSQLWDDAARDRASFRRGCRQATEGQEPSKCFNTLNAIIDSVECDDVNPARACVELCVDPGDDPAGALSRWLNGTVNATLASLMDGDVVHYQRFRLAMPEALHAINQRRIFSPQVSP